MKRIAIFFDGTGNRHDVTYQTNVVLMSRAVAHRCADGRPQIVQYYPGVGSGRGSNWVSRNLDTLLGSMLALGIVDILAEAFRHLAFSYEPGDEIHVYGFSRGAFMARLFVGLIRCSGIPPRRNVGMISTAVARFVSRHPATAPDHPDSWAFRAAFAPYTATSVEEQADRLAQGGESILLEISYVGLWDTVRSIVLPQRMPGSKDHPDRPFLFHDLCLSRMVRSARHAMALDERRRLYSPVPWSNLEDLNTRMGDPLRPYQQQWFPGDHGSVGGGGEEIGLSSIALDWVAAGAERAGLEFGRRELHQMDETRNLTADLHNKGGPKGVLGMMLKAMRSDRPGPVQLQDLSLAALERYRRDPRYRPSSLRLLRNELEGLVASEIDAVRAGFLRVDPVEDEAREEKRA